MGKQILINLLMSNQHMEPDDMLYVAADTVLNLDTEVDVYPSDPDRPARFKDRQYLLGIEEIRDAIDALELELGREATPKERLAAVKHYIDHDAFMPLEMLIDG